MIDKHGDKPEPRPDLAVVVVAFEDFADDHTTLALKDRAADVLAICGALPERYR